MLRGAKSGTFDGSLYALSMIVQRVLVSKPDVWAPAFLVGRSFKNQDGWVPKRLVSLAYAGVDESKRDKK